MTTIGNSFSDIAKKYIQNAPSAGEVSKVTTDTQNYLDQLTSQAVNEVSADNPDYQIEDNGASWQEGVSTVLSGLQGLANSTNQVIQSLSQTASDSDKANEKEYVSKAADGYNKTLADFNKNPEKNKEALLNSIGNANATIGTLGTEIAALEKENVALEKAVNGDVKEVLGNLKLGAQQAVNDRSAAEQRIEDITCAITDIAVAMTDNDENIEIVNDKTIKVSNLSDEAKELADVKGAEVVEIKADETKTNENIQTLLANFNEKNGECNRKQSEVGQLEGKVNTAESTYSSAKATYDSTPATITVTEGTGENAKQVTKENPEKANAKTAMEQAKQAVEKAKAELEKAKQEKTKLDEELKEIGSNIKVGNTTLDKIVEARGRAEAERDEAQGRVDEYAVQLKGYINESESLKNLASQLTDEQKQAFNAKTENNNLIEALLGCADQFNALTADTTDAATNATKKLEENNKALVTKKADKTALESFVKNAEAAIAKNIKTSDDTPQAGDKSSTPVDGGDKQPAPASDNEGAAHVTPATVQGSESTESEDPDGTKKKTETKV